MLYASILDENRTRRPQDFLAASGCGKRSSTKAPSLLWIFEPLFRDYDYSAYGFAREPFGGVNSEKQEVANRNRHTGLAGHHSATRGQECEQVCRWWP
jgi:hypothetical protein